MPNRKPSVVGGRISVIMPCYDSEAYVTTAVNSVLDQTYGDVELVVVDDGSTDRSVQILRSFDDRIRLITQTNVGPGSARNRGIEESSGEFIAFLDADDYWSPECLDELHAGLLGSSAALAYCGWQNVGLHGPRGEKHVPPDYENEEKAVSMLRDSALWPIHGVLTRRKALHASGGFDPRWIVCEDYDLWLRLAIPNEIVRVPKVLAFYRHHKALKDTDRGGLDAEYVWRIKKAFVKEHPELVRHVPADTLRNCIDGGLLRRGYEFYWRRELRSAQRVFRRVVRTQHFQSGDLKYLLPALLPSSLYLRLMHLRDRKGGNESAAGGA